MLFKDKAPSTQCPVERCLDLVGNKWQLCILWKLRQRSFTFGQFLTEIPDISRKVLTAQLKSLVSHGFVDRQRIDGGQVEYSLNDTGRGFTHALLGVAAWADQNKATVNSALAAKYPGTRLTEN